MGPKAAGGNEGRKASPRGGIWAEAGAEVTEPASTGSGLHGEQLRGVRDTWYVQETVY